MSFTLSLTHTHTPTRIHTHSLTLNKHEYAILRCPSLSAASRYQPPYYSWFMVMVVGCSFTTVILQKCIICSTRPSSRKVEFYVPPLFPPKNASNSMFHLSSRQNIFHVAASNFMFHLSSRQNSTKLSSTSMLPLVIPQNCLFVDERARHARVFLWRERR